MIVAAHQPVYLPGIIFFNKLALADVFVFLSDVQLMRGRSWQTRNRIRSTDGMQFLSVPVYRKGRADQTIGDTALADPDWSRRHVATLRHVYGRRPHFAAYFDGLAATLSAGYSDLAALNIAVIKYLAECFGLATPLHNSAEFCLMEGKNERLIDLSRQLGGDAYISNVGSAAYVDEALFARNGVRHLWQHFTHPVYEQGAPFIANLSAVDVLFNLGPAAGDVIRRAGSAKPERPLGANASTEMDGDEPEPAMNVRQGS